MEYDPLQICNAILQSTSPILPQVELSILQTSLNNPFVTRTNAAGIIRKICDRKEIRRQLSAAVPNIEMRGGDRNEVWIWK